MVVTLINGAASMTVTTRMSTPIITMVTPAAVQVPASLEETLVFNELPAPLARVLLTESGTAAGRGWASSCEEDACALLGAAGLDDGEQLSLTLCDDATIQELNSEWRSVDAPTDVLSFPMDDPQLLGDLVLSLDTAERQAEERGHDLRAELRVLMVHGVLHLLGYDHETSEEDYNEMAAAERKLLTRLGWKGHGLIDASEHVAEYVAE